MSCLTCPRCHASKLEFIDYCTECGFNHLVSDEEEPDDKTFDSNKPVHNGPDEMDPIPYARKRKLTQDD